MSNLAVRIATAFVGIPLLLVIDALGGPIFAAVAGIASGVAAYEAFAIVSAAGYRPAALPGILTAAVIAPAPLLAAQPQSLWVGWLLLLMVISAAYYLLPSVYGRNMAGWGLTLAVAAYIGLCLGHLSLLRSWSDGDRWVGLLLVITWAYDSGAFFAGRTWGRRPFMAHVSPKKTMEGVAGGLALAAAAALVGVPAVHLGVAEALVLGVAGAAAAQLGDLIVSMLKREAGVKDSGHLIPGHGGLLDRIDSLLLVSVTVYYTAGLFGHGS